MVKRRQLFLKFSKHEANGKYIKDFKGTVSQVNLK